MDARIHCKVSITSHLMADSLEAHTLPGHCPTYVYGLHPAVKPEIKLAFDSNVAGLCCRGMLCDGYKLRKDCRTLDPLPLDSAGCRGRTPAMQMLWLFTSVFL